MVSTDVLLPIRYVRVQLPCKNNGINIGGLFSDSSAVFGAGTRGICDVIGMGKFTKRPNCVERPQPGGLFNIAFVVIESRQLDTKSPIVPRRIDHVRAFICTYVCIYICINVQGRA